MKSQECADCRVDGADCLTSGGVRVCSDCLFERVVSQRDALQEEVARLRRLMQQAATVISLQGPQWSHDGDEETGQHDEDCEGCAMDAAVAMLLSGLEEGNGGEA